MLALLEGCIPLWCSI